MRNKGTCPKSRFYYNIRGEKSANTNQLVKLSAKDCGKVYHIQTADETNGESV
jgi:4-hydroxy-3-methylbut-2-enyl diphosphate reductase IspH